MYRPRFAADVVKKRQVKSNFLVYDADGWEVSPGRTGICHGFLPGSGVEKTATTTTTTKTNSSVHGACLNVGDSH